MHLSEVGDLMLVNRVSGDAYAMVKNAAYNGAKGAIMGAVIGEGAALLIYSQINEICEFTHSGPESDVCSSFCYLQGRAALVFAPFVGSVLGGIAGITCSLADGIYKKMFL